MAFEENIINLFVGGIFGTLIAIGIIFLILLLIASYVYFSFAWMTIAKKLKYKRPWFSWIPFLRTAMVLQLGKFHWAWTFLALIPIIGWMALFILGIISKWRIFENRKYPGWFSLFLIIPKLGFIIHTIIIGFVAWKDRKKRLSI